MPMGFAPRLGTIASRLTRNIVSRTTLREVPKPHVLPPIISDRKPLQISTPQEFLTVIGRSCHEKLEPESWDTFWKTTRNDLKKAGLGVKERRYYSCLVGRFSGILTLGDNRYILWCMEKYRSGNDPREFGYEQKPAKVIRGYDIPYLS